MNIFTDVYFPKAARVALLAGLDPVVSYRVFTRSDGIAALKPFKMMVEMLCPSAQVRVLPEGCHFKSGDTIGIITAKFRDIVDYESMYLWYAALPSYCALEARKIKNAADDKELLAFENRHNFGAEATALTSYGAYVGGITKSSCHVGANPLNYLEYMINHYKQLIEFTHDIGPNRGVGTTPHALFAIFRGDYEAACKAYLEAFPDDNIMILNDYNNKEIDDSLVAYETLGEKLHAVRSDTCGENSAQMYQNVPADPNGIKGIHEGALIALRKALDNNGANKVKICGTSGFNAKKTERFMSFAPDAIDIIGTGSFIPKWPTATADIFEVDGERETKKGREWGYEANDKFEQVLKDFAA